MIRQPTYMHAVCSQQSYHGAALTYLSAYSVVDFGSPFPPPPPILSIILTTTWSKHPAALTNSFAQLHFDLDLIAAKGRCAILISCCPVIICQGRVELDRYGTPSSGTRIGHPTRRCFSIPNNPFEWSSMVLCRRSACRLRPRLSLGSTLVYQGIRHP